MITVKLGSVCSRVDYGLTASSTATNTGVRFLRITDIDGETIDWATVPFVDAGVRDLERNRLAPGDVVVARTGASVGRSAWVRPPVPAVFASYLVRFEADPAQLESRFLGLVLKGHGWRDYVSSVAHGKSAQPNMSASAMAEFEFGLPPLSTQRAIAEVLGALDDKIAANTSVAHGAEQLLSAEFTRLQTDVDARRRPITEFLELNPRCAASQRAEPIYVDMQKLPTNGSQIVEWDFRPAKGGARFMNGDTLFARITPCLENRKAGYVDFLEAGESGVGSTEFIVMRAKPGLAKPLSFLFAVDERFRDYAVQQMIGSSGRQRVSASDLAQYEISLPDGDRLEALGERANALFSLVASFRDESRHLAALRDTLLPHLMSGRITVRDAEKQVVQVL